MQEGNNGETHSLKENLQTFKENLKKKIVNKTKPRALDSLNVKHPTGSRTRVSTRMGSRGLQKEEPGQQTEAGRCGHPPGWG